MTTIVENVSADGTGVWFGYDDFEIFSPDRRTVVRLRYVGEPPHGDSYHELSVNEARLPGFAWSGLLSWSPCSRYFLVEWMAMKYERKVAMVDVQVRRYFVLPLRTSRRSIVFPDVFDSEQPVGNPVFTVGSNDTWTPFP